MRNSLVLYVFLVLALVLSGCAKGKKQLPEARKPAPAIPPVARPLTPEQQEIKQILEKNGARRLGPNATVILVRKQDRKLTVYKGLTPLKSYPVVLGANPRNDKLCQGDQCTPEGVYRVVTKFDHPRWDKFILLDYPNTQNWLKFNRAKYAGKLPHDAQIGGEIGIHGTHDPMQNITGENWTLGCVSLLNQHIEEFYPLVNDNTLVVIKRH
jgi:murein L,D-transpeptidase YafK